MVARRVQATGVIEWYLCDVAMPECNGVTFHFLGFLERFATSTPCS